MGDSQIRCPRSVGPSCGVDQSWSQHLKCQICFNYLRQPQTLTCGHSFCKRCLLQLGKTTRAVHPEVPLRYLLLPCPICRTPILAAPIMKGFIATSFLIQNLVTEWKKMRRKMQSRSTMVTLRSVCTQTDRPAAARERGGVPPAPSASAPALQPHDLQEEEEFCTTLRLRSQDLFLFRSPSTVTCVSDSSRDGEASDRPPTATTDAGGGGGSDTGSAPPSFAASSISSSSASDHAVGRGLAVWREQFRLGGRLVRRGEDQPRGGDGDPRSASWRVLLLTMWCLYSMVVVWVAQPMLPYMAVLTLFFPTLFFFK